jgi:hypothetical protein
LKTVHEEVDIMAVFYDPVDERDLGRVKRVLDKGGIEFFLRRQPAAGIGSMQVLVAEEDIPKAEKLLMEEELKKEPPR